MSFRVNEIEDDHVVHDLEGFLDEAQLEFSLGDLMQFNIGELWTARCILRGFDGDTWLRFDCR